MQKSVPIMLIAATAALALVACAGGGGKNSSSTTTTTTTTQSSPGASPTAAMSPGASPTAAMSPGASPTALATTMTSGKMVGAAAGGSAAGQKVYSTNCSSCHQANGKGSPGVFPPLAGNPVVTGDSSKVIHIVKNGLSGKISVNGATFNGQMPAWKGTLSDADIAAVITYVRSSWGNKASAVTASQVTSTK